MKKFLILIIFALAAQVTAQEPLVKQIEIRGLRRIDEYAVRSKISQKAGVPLSPEKISEDIKNIINMNYFEDVRVEMEFFEGGIKLIYIVKEKPTISAINFYGNKEYDDEKLRGQIALTRGSIADATLIQDNALKIKAFYESEGYWLSEVIPLVRQVTETDASVTFLIDEKSKVKIGHIEIVGNKTFSDGDIKDVMKTSEWWIFSFITSGGYYNSATMKQDIESIKDLYFNNGYINVRVSEPEIGLSEDNKRMTITITLSEGQQYSVSSVSLTGYHAYSHEELEKLIKLTAGKIFRRNILTDDIRALTDFYSERGYALISIDPEVVPDKGADTVKVVYHVIEGDIYHIGRIEISGNTKTKDKVIRREIRLDEGDLFNSAAIKRSYQRLNNLNFFETVQLQPKPEPEKKLLDLDVTVKEKPTGTLSVGGGYSTQDKIVGMIDLTQANLFGNGQYLKLKGEFGSTSTTYELSFTDPWFLDKELSMTVSLYKNSRDYVQYNRKATGIGLGLGKALGEFWKVNATYNFEDVTYSNITADAPDTIKNLQGRRITSSISPSIARDSRDYYLDPHEGSRNALYTTLAGFGGDNKYFRGLIDSQWFFPIGATTIGLRGRFGYATGLFGKELPDDVSFYVGGINTVRGLGYGQAGPRSSNGDVIGGNRELIFNVEYIFPLIPAARLKGLVFFDAGAGYAPDEEINSLRRTTGLGIRWISPVGPLRLEWGYNLSPRPDESQSKFEFTFGTFF